MKSNTITQCTIASILIGGWVLLGVPLNHSAASAEAAPGKPLHLKVDFAAPQGKGQPEPRKATTKPGWWHWVLPCWDLYRSDLKWEDNSSSYPKDGPGIAGSGVHVAVTCHYEGILTLYVAGLRRYLAGGLPPEKKPLFEPLSNSWIAASDFPNNPSSDLLLAFYDLPPGHYRLISYHNSFNGRRIGDSPTGVEYEQTKQPEPPMKSIRVYSMKSIVTDYFEVPLDEKTLPKGKFHGSSLGKILVPGKEGTGAVRQTLEATDVEIQQVKTDAELKPSTVEFTTDGSPAVVVYAAGCCKSDDLRRHRRGGYAVLNAFELLRIGAEK